MIKPPIHPATPPKLRTAFKRAGYNFHKLAQARGVNVYHVHRLIHYGIEPGNLNIRKMLFLPRKPRDPNKPRNQPLPDHVKWWRYKLTKESRNAIVERLYQHAQDINKG